MILLSASFLTKNSNIILVFTYIYQKMNIKIFLFLTLLISLKIGKSQCFSPCIELSFIEPLKNTGDLKQLDSYFKDVRVVGMGESTHGTHEFSTMRHRVFKYLVESHGFNTFFLEADYANCLRVNDYIHGKEDKIYDVVNEINLWPWMTEEMADLINWMKTYNTENPDNQLNFIGVDMQDFNSTVYQIDQLRKKYKIIEAVSKPSNISTKSKNNKEKLETYIKYLNERKEVEFEKFNTADKTKYKILIRHLNQIIQSEANRKDFYFRNKKMGENILFHLESDTTMKGFFWAHNGHINKWVKSKNEKKKKWIGFAGGYLKNALGDGYLSIGQDFDEGSFNAYYLDSNSTNIIEGKRYTLSSISAPLSFEGSFAALYRNSPSPLFINFADFQDKYKEHKKYFLIHSIGALYIPRKHKQGKIQWGLYIYNQLDSFDAVILIKKSTPTHLLKVEN